MAEGSGRILQFKITLKDIRPPIWRRIQVPENFTFQQLHRAIQMAMGWRDCHLHCFEMCGMVICDPDQIDDFWESKEKHIDEAKTYVRVFFANKKDKAKYEYDFGNIWCHTVELESIEPANPGEIYPKCIKGRRACPPEDCGGSWGYEELLETLRNPSSENYKEMKEWLKQINYHPFDPAKYSCEGAFDNWQNYCRDIF